MVDVTSVVATGWQIVGACVVLVLIVLAVETACDERAMRMRERRDRQGFLEFHERQERLVNRARELKGT